MHMYSMKPVYTMKLAKKLTFYLKNLKYSRISLAENLSLACIFTLKHRHFINAEMQFFKSHRFEKQKICSQISRSSHFPIPKKNAFQSILLRKKSKVSLILAFYFVASINGPYQFTKTFEQILNTPVLFNKRLEILERIITPDFHSISYFGCSVKTRVSLLT